MPERTLMVTNDFPPREGGIEVFAYEMARRLAGPDGAGVTVLTSGRRGGTAGESPERFDRRQPFEVVRVDTGMLLPTPKVARRAAALAAERGCTRVVFGAAAPLGLMAGRLRRDGGVRRIVGLTHGHEAWWARLPGTRQALRRIGDGADHLTYIGGYTRDAIAPALSPAARERMVRLAPGVDTGLFRPGGDPSQVRDRYGLGEGPVVLSASRLVPRKGVDALIQSMPWVRARFPHARLLVVGDGPDRERLRRLAEWTGVGEAVVFAGPVAHGSMPPYYAAADLFAMPCRTRRLGFEAEGLGIVFLEAAASGLPVLAGSSGGAPETVAHGRTGYVVDGGDAEEVAGRIIQVVGAEPAAKVMGEAGRKRVEHAWTWEGAAERLESLLAD
ncbi:glycosyltransferase family 4 protein [Nocardiopsis suaedae]|uniref:Glycosyltransferase family 4 protein n=1 Tax=Nocardiopsis suaedae TaxID=3018444 RepID=A0ABT4TUP7_9ACTN|nr:glycosyltransferase family 4 protein [Nocardiopsis suaedae]MDA2808439.1 glycosyltransferase family 4 protein [Nocardiopsis suaedae]